MRHASIFKKCPTCAKDYIAWAETLFHIGMAHNDVSISLPKNMLASLLVKNMVADPNKRNYECHIC